MNKPEMLSHKGFCSLGGGGEGKGGGNTHVNHTAVMPRKQRMLWDPEGHPAERPQPLASSCWADSTGGGFTLSSSLKGLRSSWGWPEQRAFSSPRRTPARESPGPPPCPCGLSPNQRSLSISWCRRCEHLYKEVSFISRALCALPSTMDTVQQNCRVNALIFID